MNLAVATNRPCDHLALIPFKANPGRVVQEGAADGRVRVRRRLVAEVTMNDVVREQVDCVLRQVGRRI